MGSIALVVVGAIDFAFQRWQQEEDLKMTKQEVKDETKENEGDPQIRARIRKLQGESAKQRALNDVPKATVVITNPTHLAIAIRYERATMSAPIVLAKGEGIMAKRIRRRAIASGVPVIERKPLARALYAATKVGSEIPTSLYRAIAEILAHVYGLQRG
jgi:flagellar biosynthetic protein FlhB